MEESDGYYMRSSSIQSREKNTQHAACMQTRGLHIVFDNTAWPIYATAVSLTGKYCEHNSSSSLLQRYLFPFLLSLSFPFSPSLSPSPFRSFSFPLPVFLPHSLTSSSLNILPNTHRSSRTPLLIVMVED